jgi:hypothetical protein
MELFNVFWDFKLDLINVITVSEPFLGCLYIPGIYRFAYEAGTR